MNNTISPFERFLDEVMKEDEKTTSPIPAFYFDVQMYDQKHEGNSFLAGVAKGAVDTFVGGMIGGMMKKAINKIDGGGANGLPTPGDTNIHNSFIEVSGLEIGLEGKKTYNEGGYNYPIDLPDKMKNSAITLKRLVRPDIIKSSDPWTKWCEESFAAMASWNEQIKLKGVQVNVMHPNLTKSGKPQILISMEFNFAYPSKMSLSALNSTSEDLLVQEIELSYAFSKVVAH